MAVSAQSRDATLTKDGVNSLTASFTAKIDKAEMAALYLEGATTKELADRYGVKTPAITRALNSVGIKPRRPAPVNDAALAELVAELIDAGQALGLKPSRTQQLWVRIRKSLGWQAQ